VVPEAVTQSFDRMPDGMRVPEVDEKRAADGATLASAIAREPCGQEPPTEGRLVAGMRWAARCKDAGSPDSSAHAYPLCSAGGIPSDMSPTDTSQGQSLGQGRN
jgi:hypothetical protein